MERLRNLAALGLIVALGSACNSNELAASPAGEGPIAEIAAQTEYSPLDTAVFDGSGSHDPDGGEITDYEWEMIEVPSGSTSTIQSIDDTQVEFFVDLAGSYKIRLTVTDDEGDKGSTTFEFGAIPGQSMHVQLTWDTYTVTDIDLHLVNVGAGGTYVHQMYDCYYANCKPDGFSGELDWGVASVDEDNPTLDIDNISESAPENINIDTPANGSYTVMVHYFSADAFGSPPPSTWTIRIYLAGSLVYEQVRTFSQVDDLWTVARIDWASGQGSVTEINTAGTAP